VEPARGSDDPTQSGEMHGRHVSSPPLGDRVPLVRAEDVDMAERVPHGAGERQLARRFLDGESVDRHRRDSRQTQKTGGVRGEPAIAALNAKPGSQCRRKPCQRGRTAIDEATGREGVRALTVRG
jgi:hypothetical protein